MTQNAKPGFRQQPKSEEQKQLEKRSIIERVGGLENAYQGMVESINKIFSGNAKRLGLIEKAMGAVIETVGVERVTEILATKAKREQDQRDAALKAMVDESLQKGEIELTDKIAEDSLIVGVDKNAAGEATSGRAQLTFGELAEAYKEMFLGKGVGAIIPTKPHDEDGTELPAGTFEILEIYKVLPKKEEPATAPVEAPVEPPAGATHADQVAPQETA